MEFRVPLELQSNKVAYSFMFAIPIVGLFYFLASINEGNLKVASNNQSNAISLFVFISAFFLFNKVIEYVLFSVCYGFLLTRIIMLLALVNKSKFGNISLRKPNFSFMRKIIAHGIPITLLFFAQKYIQTESLLIVSEGGESASVLQIILTISLFFNLFSNAISTNGFVKISKDPKNVNLKLYFIYSLLMCFLAFLFLVCIFEVSNGFLLKLLLTKNDVYNQLYSLKSFVYIFIATDMIFVISLFFSRGVGDNFRVQCLWALSILLGYVVIYDNLNIANIILVFSFSAFIASVYGIIFVIKKQSELKGKLKWT